MLGAVVSRGSHSRWSGNSMARFDPERPIETSDDSILVEDLPLGRHVFRLVVTDRDGNRSEPDEIEVTVERG